MGVIPWGFESPLRHQVGRRGNGARVKRGEGEDMNAVRVRPVSTPLGAARRESKLPCARSALRQVPIPGFVFVKGGREPPFHTFPPVTQAANKFAATIFCALGQASLALKARRPGNAHQKNRADLRSASRRAGQGTPTSGRHSRRRRAAGRTPTPRMARAERRSPTGIARERETSADDAAPRSGESHVFFMTGKGARNTRPPEQLPGGGRRPHPPTATATERSGPGRSAAAWVGERIPVHVSAVKLHLEGKRRADLILKVLQ